ncbi:hypothetical protein P4E94_18645, partial [Pontiellaceae bacterium B12219]|nr:hypothetical protein [Pontiellaceae bacterium B12219]
MHSKKIRTALAGLLIISMAVWADDVSSWEQWSGLTVKKGTAILTLPGEASFTYPDGERGGYRFGLSFQHDGSANWRDYYGIRFEMLLPTDAVLEATATMENAPYKLNKGSTDVTDVFTADFGLQGQGWHTVTLPFESFNMPAARPFALETIKTFSLNAAFADGSTGKIKLRNLQLVKGDILALESPVRSASAQGGGQVVYAVEDRTPRVYPWMNEPGGVMVPSYGSTNS